MNYYVKRYLMGLDKKNKHWTKFRKAFIEVFFSNDGMECLNIYLFIPEIQAIWW